MLKAVSIASSLFLASIGPSLAWYCPPGDTDCINERNSYHYRQQSEQWRRDVQETIRRDAEARELRNIYSYPGYTTSSPYSSGYRPY